MPLWKLHDLQAAVGQKPMGENVEITGVSVDSRTTKKGDLFVAFKGEYDDGHNFVLNAAKEGAAAVLVERKFPDLSIAQIIVPNVNEAFWQIAAAARQRFKGKVIAITGSCGKTTTKDFLAAALQAHAPLYSFNNQRGVPLTLARMPANKKFAVIEIGTNSVGEISSLSELTKPHIALVLNIKPVHLAGFKNLAELKEEKFSIADGLVKGGTFIAPDDFGTEDFKGKIPQPTPARIACASAALAVVKIMNFDEKLFASRIEKIAPAAGRGQVKIINGITIIDDSYNANPASLTAALKALKTMPATGKKFAIIGDMLELGDGEIKFHQALAEHCQGLDGVICVGELMQHLHQALPPENKYLHIPAVRDIPLKAIAEKAKAEDIILVKASNSIFWKNNFVQKLKEILNAKK